MFMTTSRQRINCVYVGGAEGGGVAALDAGLECKVYLLELPGQLQRDVRDILQSGMPATRQRRV
jgi:hypothetical protein